MRQRSTEHLGVVCRSADGCMNPVLSLVRELTGRGLTVSMVCNPSYRESVASSGATALPLSSFQAPYPSAEALAKEAIQSLPGISSAWKMNPPTVLASHFLSPGGQAYAQLKKIPHIKLWTSYALSPQLEAPPELSLFHPNGSAVSAANTRLSEEMYGAPSNRPFLFNPGELNISFCAPPLQADWHLFDETFHFVGLATKGRKEAPIPEGIRTPFLLASLGTEILLPTQHEIFGVIASAFCDSDFQVVMSTGRKLQSSALGLLPSNVVCFDYFPQASLLKTATAFITHAGMNSVMEALSCAVPLICLPQIPEQALTARRIQELGLGLHIGPNEVTAGRLREAVQRCLADARMKRRLQVARDQILSRGGINAAADAVMTFISKRSQVLS